MRGTPTVLGDSNSAPDSDRQDWLWSRYLRALQIGSVIVPLLILVVWGVQNWETKHSEAVTAAQGNVELVRQYAHKVIQSQQSLLSATSELISTADLASNDQEEFHNILGRLSQNFPFTLSIGLVSPEGRLILSNLAFPIDVEVDDREYFQILRDGNADFHIERVTLRPGGYEALALAVRRPGDAFTGVLVATVDIRAFTDFFGRVVDDDRASASLMRSDGMLLVRHTPDAPATLLPADVPVMQAIARADFGVYEALAITDNIERIYGYARVADLPLFVNFGIPKAAIFESWLSDMVLIGSFLALASFLGLFGTWQVGRRIEAEQARQHAEFDRRLLDESRKTAAIRETLLHEIHHRTRNNLQTIQALIRLHGRRKRGESGIEEIEHRIWAISELHDLLYTSRKMNRLDIGKFLETVCTNSALVPPDRRIAMHCEVDEIEVGFDKAVPIALVVVELATNAIKHACPGDRSGRIDITLRRGGQGAKLVVRDDGIGMSEESRRNSGLGLVSDLVRQIDGTIEVEVDAGTVYRIGFPLEAEAGPQSEAA